MVLNWTSFTRMLDKYNDKFNAWFDKFTDNGALAMVVTIALFILIVVVVGNLSKKQK